jgi:hypothetical protein
VVFRLISFSLPAYSRSDTFRRIEMIQAGIKGREMAGHEVQLDLGAPLQAAARN